MKRFVIASVHYPSGASWLWNCLVELNVCVYRGSSLSETWKIEAERGYSLSDKSDSIRTLIPSIDADTTYFFEPGIAVQFTHELPEAENFNIPTIIFVRDPRDAIYSQFRRINNSSFSSYSEYVEELDPVFCLRPLETFQLFYWAWNQVHTSMTIRFEERFADSKKILSSVCDFIGISRTEDQIVMAIRNSTFDKSARVEARVLDSPIKYTQHRAGIESEWKSNTESFEVAKLMSVPTPNPDSLEYSVPETFVGVQNISLLIAHRASQGGSFIGQEIRRHYATLQKSVIPDARLLERAIERQMCFEPMGSKTSLSLYSCGIRIAMKIRNLSLFTLSIRAWKLEILSALRRRLTVQTQPSSSL